MAMHALARAQLTAAIAAAVSSAVDGVETAAAAQVGGARGEAVALTAKCEQLEEAVIAGRQAVAALTAEVELLRLRDRARGAKALSLASSLGEEIVAATLEGNTHFSLRRQVLVLEREAMHLRSGRGAMEDELRQLRAAHKALSSRMSSYGGGEWLLMRLPPEAMRGILSHLTLGAAAALAQTCRAVHHRVGPSLVSAWVAAGGPHAAAIRTRKSSHASEVMSIGGGGPDGDGHGHHPTATMPQLHSHSGSFAAHAPLGSGPGYYSHSFAMAAGSGPLSHHGSMSLPAHAHASTLNPADSAAVAAAAAAAMAAGGGGGSDAGSDDGASTVSASRRKSFGGGAPTAAGTSTGGPASSGSSSSGLFGSLFKSTRSPGTPGGPAPAALPPGTTPPRAGIATVGGSPAVPTAAPTSSTSSPFSAFFSGSGAPAATPAPGKGGSGLVDYRQAQALFTRVRNAEVLIANLRMEQQDLSEKLRTAESVRDFLRKQNEALEAETKKATGARDAALSQRAIDRETLLHLDEEMQRMSGQFGALQREREEATLRADTAWRTVEEQAARVETLKRLLRAAQPGLDVDAALAAEAGGEPDAASRAPTPTPATASGTAATGEVIALRRRASQLEADGVAATAAAVHAENLARMADERAAEAAARQAEVEARCAALTARVAELEATAAAAAAASGRGPSGSIGGALGEAGGAGERPALATSASMDDPATLREKVAALEAERATWLSQKKALVTEFKKVRAERDELAAAAAAGGVAAAATVG